MAVAHTQVQAQNSGQKFDIQEQQHNNRHLHHQSSTTMASSASTPSASSAAAASSDPIISTDPAFGVHSPATWSGHEVNAGQKRMSGDDSGNSSGGVKKQQQQQQKKEKEKQNKWPRGKKPAVVIIARYVRFVYCFIALLFCFFFFLFCFVYDGHGRNEMKIT